jgi:hypothetical protein
LASGSDLGILAIRARRVVSRGHSFGLLVETSQAKLIDYQIQIRRYAGRKILLSQKANLHILSAIPIESDPMNLQMTSLLCPLSLSQLKEFFPYVCLL